MRSKCLHSCLHLEWRPSGTKCVREFQTYRLSDRPGAPANFSSIAFPLSSKRYMFTYHKTMQLLQHRFTLSM